MSPYLGPAVYDNLPTKPLYRAESLRTGPRYVTYLPPMVGPGVASDDGLPAGPPAMHDD
jgi:hypothetical protein